MENPSPAIFYLLLVDHALHPLPPSSLPSGFLLCLANGSPDWRHMRESELNELVSALSLH